MHPEGKHRIMQIKLCARGRGSDQYDKNSESDACQIVIYFLYKLNTLFELGRSHQDRKKTYWGWSSTTRGEVEPSTRKIQVG